MYEILLVSDKARKIDAKAPFLDPGLPGVLICRTVDEDILYIPITNYKFIKVDGAEFEKTQQESKLPS